MDKIESRISITPETRLGALLKDYPQLEGVLMEMSPAFKKLRNPILRKTVAKVASLRQVAEVGNIPLATLINGLRQSAGVEGELMEDRGKPDDEAVPEWFDSSKVVKTFDARPMLETGEHPLNYVMADLGKLDSDQSYELITPFVPSPMIDIAKSKGYLVWSRIDGPELIKTYFRKAKNRG